MAKDDSFAGRRREREKDEARKNQIAAENEGPDFGVNESGQKKTQREFAAEIDILLRRAEPMVEQVNQAYNKFFIGLEFRPPTDLRKQLDNLIDKLDGTAKALPIYQFRYDSVRARYMVHRARWDKIMRDLEDGRIKRVVKVKRNAS